MNRIGRYKILFGITIVLLPLIWGCTTTKNTATHRAYHNITAKYNYYFNARESYNNATQRVALGYSYNFSLLLPVSLAGDQQVSGSVGGDMDRAIMKSTDLISKHSISVKPERKRGVQTAKEKEFYNQNEFVHYVREAWLLIGKARVWKAALDEAEMTFEYVLMQFPNTRMWYEASVWLARIDILRKDYVSAEDRLRAISTNRKYPKNKYFTHLLESTWADYYFKQERYDKVPQHLEKALKSVPDRATRLRYTYLLAQLRQRDGKYAQSNKLFKKILRMSPSYEVSFNARVNIASNAQSMGKGSDMKKQLLKMSRDGKNQEYLDQIYYALGNIENKEGNIEKAIEYYKLSARSSVKNNHQKGISYLVLADYYFAKPNYTVSQAYYDSAYRALDQDYPGYQELETKTQNLNRLVENLNVVQHEDSLLRVAAMSPKERDALIADLIKLAREDEERQKREEQEGRDRFAQFQQTQRGRSAQTEGGGWYFYNQSSLSFGLSEFNMKWGRRKLEDNWRRINKRVVASDALTSTDQVTDSTGAPMKVLDNKSREFYLQDLPLNDSLVNISYQKIEEAMFRVGEIYQTLIKDYPEAIKAYNRLLERFPNGSNALQAHYNLYQISRFTENNSEAERYKQLLISKFPTSPYALMLSNPNYVDELRKRESELASHYEETYEQFKKGNYRDAAQRSREGLEMYKDSAHAPKYQFILAQSIGKTGDIRQYKEELSKVVSKYPKADVAKTAADIIVYLDKIELQLATGQMADKVDDGAAQDSLVSLAGYVEPDGKHLFVAVIPKNSPINQLRFNMVSFNVDNFLNLNLSVNSKELTKHISLIVVEPLKNKDEAMEYYRKAVAEQGLMGTLQEKDYSLFVISEENFTIFMEDKSVVDYLNFFTNKYKP